MTCRVLYHWRVPAAHRAEFLAAWARTTDAIHASTPGAQGSLCLQNADDPERFITQASWDSLDQWRAFIGAARTGKMSVLHEIAELEKTEAYALVDDRTR